MSVAQAAMNTPHCRVAGQRKVPAATSAGVSRMPLGSGRKRYFGRIDVYARHGPTSSPYWNAIALAICAM